MGATHFLMKRLKNVATEMALNVLGYNLTRVLSNPALANCGGNPDNLSKVCAGHRGIAISEHG
jgi:hypothetical protein